MSESENCRVCGQKRPTDAPSGLCPACLLKVGLVAAGSELHDVTILFGPASSSVLAAFGEEFGKIPPVLLRDTDSVSEPGPVIRPSSAEIPDPELRSTRLQLLGEIARGGMGAVLKGRDADLGRDLAVKILLEAHRDKPEMVRRFIEEAQIAGQLQHPGIVPVYELGAFGDRRPYFAMKLVKGHTLAEILASRKSLDEGLPRLLSIFESICQTMAYAHARGVIHRDLKPSNVMVGSFGEVQVMDWGLAKVLPRGGTVDDASAGHTTDQGTVIATARGDMDSDLSRAGSVMGTPSYMAPEQARGEIDQVDERADVFALGSIFCELLSGQPAFTGRNSGEIQRKASRGELADAIARLDQNQLGHDPELIALGKACLSPERDDRPKNASKIADRMSLYHSRVQERLRQSEIGRAEEKARAEEAIKRAAVERQRLRLTVALAASVMGLMVLGGGGSVYFAQQRAARQVATENVVNEAINKANLLRGQAKAAPVGDLSRWTEVLAAGNEAKSALKAGESSDPLRVRVEQLLDTIEHEQAEASRLAGEKDKDRKLLERLEAIRFEFADKDGSSFGFRDQNTAEKTDAAYATAFREFGVDVDQLDPTETGRLLRQRSQPQEFAFRLDAWALIRKTATYTTGKVDESWKKLIVAAQNTDDDPWRNSVRSLLGRADHPAVRRLASDENELAKQPARSLYLLAEVLEDTRGRLGSSQPYLKESIDILKRAWRLSPNDYQICRKISMESQGKLDSIRFATAAVAAAPDSPLPRETLAEGLMSAYRNPFFNYQHVVRAGEKNTEAGPRLAFKQKNGDTWFIGPNRFVHTDTVTEDSQDDGLADLRWAIRLDPKSIHHHSMLADALVRQGRYDDAMKECQIIAGMDSKLSPAQLIGTTLYGMGQLDRLLELIQGEIKKEPNGLHDHGLLGMIYHEQRKEKHAFAEFRTEFLSEAAGFYHDYQYQGFSGDVIRIAMESTGSPEEVLAAYSQAIEFHPEKPEFPELLATLLLKEGRTEEAVTVYRQAIKGHSDKIEFHKRLTQLLEQQGKIAESNLEVEKVIALYLEKLKSNPTDPSRYDLAWLYFSRNQRNEAKAQFRLWIKSSPSILGLNSFAMQLAASTNAKDRDGEIALEAATKACQLSGWGNPMTLDTLANAYAECGDFEAAVEWQTKAIELFRDKNELEDCKARLKLYQEKKPYHYPDH